MSMSDAIVVLDPGHGGTEPCGKSSPYGARQAGMAEKDVNLELARQVAAKLGGHRVVMTRNGDTNLSLEERANMTRGYGGRVLFVSLHSSPGGRGGGAETWVHTRANRSSELLAESIQNRLAGYGGAALGVYRGDLAVLEPDAQESEGACMVEAEVPVDDGMEPAPEDLEPVSKAIASGIREHLATAASGNAVEVVVGSSGWGDRAAQALRSGRAVRFVFTGRTAQRALEAIATIAAERGIRLSESPQEVLRQLRQRFPDIRSRLSAIGEHGRRLWNRLTSSQGHVGEAQELITATTIVVIIVAVAVLLGITIVELFRYMNYRREEESIGEWVRGRDISGIRVNGGGMLTFEVDDEGHWHVGLGDTRDLSVEVEPSSRR